MDTNYKKALIHFIENRRDIERDNEGRIVRRIGEALWIK
jgi:hypothetical protein